MTLGRQIKKATPEWREFTDGRFEFELPDRVIEVHRDILKLIYKGCLARAVSKHAALEGWPVTHTIGELRKLRDYVMASTHDETCPMCEGLGTVTKRTAPHEWAPKL